MLSPQGGRSARYCRREDVRCQQRSHGSPTTVHGPKDRAGPQTEGQRLGQSLVQQPTRMGPPDPAATSERTPRGRSDVQRRDEDCGYEARAARFQSSFASTCSMRAPTSAGMPSSSGWLHIF